MRRAQAKLGGKESRKQAMTAGVENGNRMERLGGGEREGAKKG